MCLEAPLQLDGYFWFTYPSQLGDNVEHLKNGSHQCNGLRVICAMEIMYFFGKISRT